MKIQLLLIMLIMCLISSACGRKNALKPSQGNEKQSLCPAAEVTGRTDYQVILPTKLVKKVLNEISFIPNFSMANFWKDLSPETSDELNFQLNIILINNPYHDSLTIYRATAMFFSMVLGIYQDDVEYRIYEISGKSIAFRTQAFVRSSQAITQNCGSATGVDVSFIKIPTEKIILAGEVKEVYQCLTEDQSFSLLETSHHFVLRAEDKTYRLSRSASKIVSTRLKYEVEIKTDDVFLDLNIRKYFGNEIGKKASIELKLPDYSIDGPGRCTTLKRSL